MSPLVLLTMVSAHDAIEQVILRHDELQRLRPIYLGTFRLRDFGQLVQHRIFPDW